MKKAAPGSGIISPPISHPPGWMATGAIIATAGVFVIAQGLTYPLLAMILKAQGVSATLIGANSAMTPLGVIVSAPFIPWLAQRLGAARLAALCVVLAAMILTLIGAFQDIWFWFPARLALGVAINGSYIISETWVIQLSSSHNRGRIMGIYTTVLSAGFALGPFILALTGTGGWTPFLVVIIIMTITVGVLLAIRSYMPEFGKEDHGSVRSFFLLAPSLLAVIVIIAFFDQAVFSLLPIYGLHYNLTEQVMSFAVGVLISGSVVLQYPIGWLADRMPRQKVMLICALITVAGSFLLPFAITSTVFLWPLLFLWGGFAFGSYTLALVELGDRFSGSILLTGNAAFAMAWGLGGIIGPPVTGGAMDLFSPQGLPICLGISFLFLIVLTARRQPSSNSPGQGGK